MTDEQLRRWSTPKPDGSFPYPWYREWDDSYLFEVADFPTPEDCMAFGIKEWGHPGGPFSPGGYEISGPTEAAVHPHDEDEPCQPDVEHCATIERLLCWIVEPSDEDAWAVITPAGRVPLELPQPPVNEAPSLELGL